MITCSPAATKLKIPEAVSVAREINTQVTVRPLDGDVCLAIAVEVCRGGDKAGVTIAT